VLRLLRSGGERLGGRRPHGRHDLPDLLLRQRDDQFAPLLEPSDWCGYFVSHTSSHFFRAPKST
jgi:hypothetical protein